MKSSEPPDPGGPPDPAALREQIRALESQLALLRGGASLRSAPRGSLVSVRGLEEMVLLVDAQGRALRANAAMRALLGHPQAEVAGLALGVLDRTPLGAGVLAAALEEARREDRDVELLASFEDPGGDGRRHMRLLASWQGGTGQVVAQETTRHVRLEQMFARYVSPRVLEFIKSQGEDVMAPRRLSCTLLFADLRGFTAASQRLAPEAVKAMLDDYLSAAVEAIEAEDGTVDKFVGDEVMALFGAPLPCDDHPLRALRAAQALRRAHAGTLAAWKLAGRPACALGTGLNTGAVVVGNVGSPRRADFTAIGHHVNLAARLCSAAAAGEVLVSEHTVRALQELARHAPIAERFDLRRADPIEAKGLGSVPVYRLEA